MLGDVKPTPSLEQYILVALIDIYRGLKVNLPVEPDPQVQKNVLRDVLSTAISFAEKQESMQVISNELFKCNQDGCTLQEQMEIIEQQSPDVLNAKIAAAAYLLKLLNKENNLH
ncbi:hypothetical protein [Desulforamulus hydrothermalis]|uniref:Uncharacterized protein n=1 Tax=Desulforamulus hydrothermalis Lam5 = DSM 18033 TaxID=1121428 RepID=K8DYM6_9FIRM|nr:hypothetical protein [Desulforamulus hydrothermalis]CCO07964.1 conserved hypothetical protein [Desulforamulus hydrothermalis Lam5 = DSM 18033]SHG85246.1 hypothetical protein SAMN02745177_00593 [Desulforamulus hydrothermalis Lam5 = DSM 18033]